MNITTIKQIFTHTSVIFFVVPPTVEILKPINEIYRVHVGQELALVCRGRGDPTPIIKWKRQVIYFVH